MLQRLDLKKEKGEFLCILSAPSGCGKSTDPTAGLD